MVTFRNRSSIFKTFVAFIIICLVSTLIYLLYCLYSSYSFIDLLQIENKSKITNCSVTIGYYGTESDGIPIPLDSDLFNQLFETLQSEEYKKPLSTILGKKVTAFHIGLDPFYRILLVHEDRRCTEIIINGDFLLIGSSPESKLKVYQIVGGGLSRKMNTLGVFEAG